MKYYIALLLFSGIFTAQALAQSVPLGMKYQAVARDTKGQVMANQDLQLKITLYSNPLDKKVAYSEIHKIITNELGLFTLSVGEGITYKGSFREVPWSSSDIWMEVAIQTDDETDFVTISDSRMLSVPYAFHAATANEILDATGTGRAGTVVPSQVWSLFGNSNTNPSRDKLGTTDMADLVIVTNNIERMRVTAGGDIEIANNVEIGDDLTVKGNVYLNTMTGETINYGDFTVEDGSNTHLTGMLMVDGHTELNSTLHVDGATVLDNTLNVDGATKLYSSLDVNGPTTLNNTLDVDGATDLHSTLDVDGLVHLLNTTQSTNTSNGALVVEGGVGIEKNLNVGGTTNFEGAVSFGGIVEITDVTQSNSTTDGALVVAGGVGIGKNLNVGGQLGVTGTNTSFMAKISNADGDTGDGLEIKLGRTHPAWNGSAYLHLTSPGAEIFDNAIMTIEGWINGEDFDPLDILDFIPNAYIAGTACNLVNLLTEQLNESIGLPASIPGFQILPPLTIVPEINLEPIATIGPYGTPAINFPTIEIIPAIPELPCDLFPSFELPVISFVDVTNSLDNDNQFISFKDKDGRELGSVRAQAVSDWQINYFDGAFLVDMLAGIVGIDFVQGIAMVINAFTNIADSYNEMGVEYASGHGDYAEWLERIDAAEQIGTGDIVAVKSGKITKDLSNAEQVMAVSSRPIVLGNSPAQGRESFGNKIAFMGQIPVKVQGPVTGGDYIVGYPGTPGYGVAVHPADMTADRVHLTVGRSWETNTNPGPKMVNTVIGVDNGNFLKIIRDNQDQLQTMEERMKDMELKMNAIVTGFEQAAAASEKLKHENEAKLQAFSAQQEIELEQHKQQKASRTNK